MTCRRRARAVAIVVAVLGCLCLAVVADEHQAPQTPTFRSQVTLVPIDVRVLDRHGRPVADLTKDDFAVSEDGVPQRISVFDRQTLVAEKAETAPPRVLRTTGAGDLKPQHRRVFLISLGRYWLPRARFEAVNAITTFLRQRLLPQDYAAVCAWDRATDITTDHETLAQVVEMLELPTHLVMLDGTQVFAPPEKAVEVDLSQWETYAAPDEDGQGLVFVEEV